MVSFTHEQNIICSQTQLDEIAHEQAIICRQLFAGHVMGFWPVKRKKDFASNDNKHLLHRQIARAMRDFQEQCQTVFSAMVCLLLFFLFKTMHSKTVLYSVFCDIPE